MTKNNRWTTEEVEILKKYYPIEDVYSLCKRLPRRNKDTIRAKAKSLKIKSGYYWTDEEKEILRQYYPTEGLSVSKRFKKYRKPHTIVEQAFMLGIKCETLWSDENIEILKEYYPTEGSFVVFRLIGSFTKRQVLTKARSLGIKYLKCGEPWSVEEDEKACRFYLNHRYDWSSKENTDQLYSDFLRDGFDTHPKASIHKKLANYSFLDTGLGLEHASIQSKEAFKRLK